MNAFQKLISEPTRARDYGPPVSAGPESDIYIADVCDGDLALIDSAKLTPPDIPAFYVNTETGKFCG